MQFYPDVAAVQVWTVLKNEGSEEIGLEYVSSFIYQGLCQNGTMKRPVSIHRITAGIARVSGEKMTAGRST